MKTLLLMLYAVLLNTYSFAQKHGVDTLAGYIVKAKDTLAGHVILPYKMRKEKKEFHKQYENEEWHQQVRFVDGSGVEKLFLPSEISAYGWNWNDTLKANFRSFKVVVPRKGAFLMKGEAKPFLKLEIEGPMSLYLYHHMENAKDATVYYNDRYLANEKGEIQPLKIKAFLGAAFTYNLKDLESWFEGYQELSKFDLKSLNVVELWLLVAAYNKWRKTANR
jgi:hypothetical protein